MKNWQMRTIQLCRRANITKLRKPLRKITLLCKRENTIKMSLMSYKTPRSSQMSQAQHMNTMRMPITSFQRRESITMRRRSSGILRNSMMMLSTKSLRNLSTILMKCIIYPRMSGSLSSMEVKRTQDIISNMMKKTFRRETTVTSIITSTRMALMISIWTRSQSPLSRPSSQPRMILVLRFPRAKQRQSTITLLCQRSLFPLLSIRQGMAKNTSMKERQLSRALESLLVFHLRGQSQSVRSSQLCTIQTDLPASLAVPTVLTTNARV